MPSRDTTVNALGKPPYVAALGVLALLFVVWAAAVPRPERVIDLLRPGAEVEQVGANDTLLGNPREPDLTPGSGRLAPASDLVAAIVGWTLVAVLVAIAVAALVAIVRGILASRDPRTPEADDAADLDLEALAMAVTTESADRLAALSAGTPAEGIVAAWSHLEATLHGAGVPLPASRTSTEVSLDVLRRFAVDPETLATLAALYREARYSRHPLTEDDRARAASAYRALDADVRSAAADSRAPRG